MNCAMRRPLLIVSQGDMHREIASNCPAHSRIWSISGCAAHVIGQRCQEPHQTNSRKTWRPTSQRSRVAAVRGSSGGGCGPLGCGKSTAPPVGIPAKKKGDELASTFAAHAQGLQPDQSPRAGRFKSSLPPSAPRGQLTREMRARGELTHTQKGPQWSFEQARSEHVFFSGHLMNTRRWIRHRPRPPNRDSE